MPRKSTPKVKSTIVLDASVLIADPHALTAFPDTRIVIPLVVVDQLDQLKSRHANPAAHNALAALRALEEARAPLGAVIDQEAPVGQDGATLTIMNNGLELAALKAVHLDPREATHRVLAAAKGLARDDERGDVTVISTDAAVRLKAAALGLAAADFIPGRGVGALDAHPGWFDNINVSSALIRATREGYGSVPLTKMSTADRAVIEAELGVNTFAVLRASDSTDSAIVRRTKDGIARKRSDSSRTTAWGLKSRSKEQAFALELLTDPDVPVVAVSGRAGTGKTILALAAALEQTMEAQRYERVMILRPMHSVGGQEMGFLPGDVADKVAPWFEAVIDAMLALDPRTTAAKARELAELWVETEKLAMEPVTFLRGRSLARTFVIVDEAQNLEPSTIKTILTRIGQDSKVVVVGDPDPAQSDNPFVSAGNNGMSHLVDSCVGNALFGHVLLTQCERSAVADMAADLL